MLRSLNLCSELAILGSRRECAPQVHVCQEMTSTNTGPTMARLRRTSDFLPCMRWIAAAGLLALLAFPSAAQTDFAWQYGSLVNPFSESGESSATSILTFQNASSWKLGGSFFFIDFIDDATDDGFNDKEFYGEWYPTLSLGKVTGKEIRIGAVRDISLVGGINFDGDADVLKILPGVQLSWAVPGFIFLNTDFAAMLDASDGVAEGGAPKTDDVGFMFDVSWLMPFKLGSISMAWAGHAEYISGVTNELGGEVKSWILAQPQLTADVTGEGWLHAGVEVQYWSNKLGSTHDEFTVQLLMVLRM